MEPTVMRLEHLSVLAQQQAEHAQMVAAMVHDLGAAQREASEAIVSVFGELIRALDGLVSRVDRLEQR